MAGKTERCKWCLVLGFKLFKQVAVILVRQVLRVDHLNTFQRSMSEFKRRISETLNFTSVEQMSWKLLSEGQIE